MPPSYVLYSNADIDEVLVMETLTMWGSHRRSVLTRIIHVNAALNGQ